MNNLYDSETRNNAVLAEGEVVVCPHCGHDYTHQGEVQAWQRDEDSDVGVWARIKQQAVVSSVVLPSGNPSPRRSGLRIKMSCEGCDNWFWIIIAQHKGQTYLYFEAYKQDQV